MLKDKWEAAMPLDVFIEQAEKDRELWQAIRRKAQVPASLLERLADVPPRRFLVLLEDWCGDASNTVPVIAKLAEAHPNFALRVLRRDEHLDLMDQYLTGTSRAIPVVIVLDEGYSELGWWGSRPAPLQKWVKSEASQAMEPADRYREVRRWYARDRGLTTLDEIAALLEETSGAEPVLVAPAQVA